MPRRVVTVPIEARPAHTYTEARAAHTYAQARGAHTSYRDGLAPTTVDIARDHGRRT